MGAVLCAGTLLVPRTGTLAVLRAGTLLVIILLACAPGSADALTFAEAPGSPYYTVEPHFVAQGGGFLGGAVAGDFNGDGTSDLAVVNSTGVPAMSAGESITVLLGHPDGGLTLAAGSPLGIFSGGIFAAVGPIASGNFNNDHNLDLAVVDGVNQTVAILLGDGTGNFQLSGTPIPFSGGQPHAITLGDFNGDGVQDLAFDSGQNINVLLGDGSGGFTPAPGSPFALSEYAASVAAGDFNSDGRSDLAVTTRPDQVAIYLAASDGGLHEAPGFPLAIGDAPVSIVATDLNGDKKTDLAIVSEGNENVTVLLGDGSGGFVPAEGSPFAVPGGPGASASSPGLPRSIAAGDFNGDSNTDLAIGNFNGSSDNVAVLQGDGHGGFTNAAGSPFPARGNPSPLAVGDFNGDGHADLAVVNPFQGFVTLLQNTNGAPQAPSPGPPARPVTLPQNTTEAEATTTPAPGPPAKPVPNPTPGPNPPKGPTRAQILALLARQLGPASRWSMLRQSAGNASFTLRFKAPEAGIAVIQWYAAPRGELQRARNAQAKPVILASGTATFSAAATTMMKISFTKAERLLRLHAGQSRLTVRGTFTPIGGAPITVVRRVV